MHRIAFCQSKGGVAKTTLSVNVAACLASRGKNVLLCDLDGQMSASDFVGFDISQQQNLLLDAMLGRIEPADAVIKTGIENLSLVPASLHLYSAESILNSEIAADSLLLHLLDDYSQSYDFCIVDCPPSINLLNWNALIAAKQVILPCEASHASLLAMKNLLRAINTLERRRDIAVNNLGIIATRVDKRTKNSQKAVQLLDQAFAGLLFDTRFTETVKVKESMAHKSPLISFAPEHNAAAEIVALTNEIEQRLANKESRHAA